MPTILSHKIAVKTYTQPQEAYALPLAAGALLKAGQKWRRPVFGPQVLEVLLCALL